MVDMLEFSAMIVRKTEKAALVSFDDGFEAWIPISVSTDLEDYDVGDIVEFMVMRWFVEKNVPEMLIYELD